MDFKQIKYTDLMKPESISVELCWKLFAGSIFRGCQITRVQHDEMRKAFYGGFSECFKIMNDISETLTEEQACEVLTRLAQENKAFVDQMLREHPPGPKSN